MFEMSVSMKDHYRPQTKFAKIMFLHLSVIPRGVVSTGPLARGHLIWPLGHLLLDSTGPDWPPKFKAYLLKKIINQLLCKNTQCKQFVNEWWNKS